MGTLKTSCLLGVLFLCLSCTKGGDDAPGADDGLPDDQVLQNDGNGNDGSNSDDDGGMISSTGKGTKDDGGDLEPARLEAIPPAYDYGLQSINSSNHKLITIVNRGDRPATGMHGIGLAAPFSFRQGTYPGYRGNCPVTINPGVSCNVSVTFVPQSANHFELNTFKIVHDDGDVTIPLEGSGSNIATLRFSNLINDNNYYSYGTIAWASNVDKTIKVHYYGARPATGVSFSGISAPFSIVSNTCGETVTADCELVVRYSGTSVGTHQQKLKVTYHNSSFAAEDNHTFYGATSPEVTPATLQITDGGSNSFGTQLVNAQFHKVFSVIKGGTMPATNVTGGNFGTRFFKFKGGSYPGVGGTCGSTISTSCTIALTFEPNALTNFSDNVVLNFHNGNANTSSMAAISGTGGNPAVLTISPVNDPYDFGSTPLRLPIDRTFTLSNPANSVAATSISISVSAPFSYLSGCTGGVATGGSCNFTIRFNPTSAGSFNRTLTVSYYDGLQSRSLTKGLTGAGTDAAYLVQNQTLYDYGNVFVGNAVTAQLAFRFYGGRAPVVTSTSGIAAPFSFPGGTFAWDSSCSGSVTYCYARVTFTPSAATTYNTTFVINYDDGMGQARSVSMNLRGTGVIAVPAVLTFRTSPYDFGSRRVNTQTNATITIDRTGNMNATSISASGLSAPITFAGGSYPGTGGTCSSSMSTSQPSCTIVVRFSPTSEAVFNRTLTLNYFNGMQSTSATLNLSGTGYHAAELISSTGVFGGVPMNGSRDVTLQIQNTGTIAASSMALGTLVQAPFSLVTNNCGTSLTVSATCTVTLRFSPTVPGLKNDTFTMNYHNGQGSVQLAVPVSGTGTVPLLIAVNGNHSCARVEDGRLKCWGQNNYGQLGLGNTVDRSTPSASGISLGSNRYPKFIAAGFYHNCAILDNDSVKCWGYNNYGQLGLGVATTVVGDSGAELGDALPALNLGTGLTPVSLVAGYAHTCALFSTGQVKCWGQNQEGQLGLGDIQDRGRSASHMGANLAFVDLGGWRAIQIAANASHTCALLENHTMKCWGNNFFGQLGQEDADNRGDEPNEMGNNLSAISLGTGRTAQSISAGGAFTCALLDNGRVKCFGRNESGILGRQWCQDEYGRAGVCADPRYPYSLRGYGIGDNQMGDYLPNIDLGSNATEIRTANSHTCARLTNGSLKCWGGNQYGQLGLGDANDRGNLSSQMGANLPAVSLGGTLLNYVSGNFHNCVLLNQVSLKCWGNNRYGGLGIGDAEHRGDNANEMGSSLPFISY